MDIMGCLYPMTIEWVPAGTGGDGAVVKPRAEVRRPYCLHPVDRWYVRLHTHLDDLIGPHHPRTLIWIAKNYP